MSIANPNPSLFQFGDIVVVGEDMIGVVVKSWKNQNNVTSHEIYVRTLRSIVSMEESKLSRYEYDKNISDQPTD